MNIRRKIGIIVICSVILLQTNVLAPATDKNDNISEEIELGNNFKINIIYGITDKVEIHIGGYGVPHVQTHIKNGFAFGIKATAKNNKTLEFIILKNVTAKWIFDPHDGPLGFCFPPVINNPPIIKDLFKRYFIWYIAFDCGIVT